MKAILFNLAVLAPPACAGTLSIDWVGGPQLAQGDLGTGEYSEEIWSPYQTSFIFDVPTLKSKKFDYDGVIDYFTAEESAIRNPMSATLLSRPDGHLNGYSEGYYTIKVRPNRVWVDAVFRDYDDYFAISSRSIFDDHNQSLFWNSSSGYWSATYTSNSPAEGESFSVAAPVPVPASLPLTVLGLGALTVVTRRSRKQTSRSQEAV